LCSPKPRRQALEFEERIRYELKQIGLLDDDENSAVVQREDDEICEELRKLQKQLRDKIEQNNQTRLKLQSMLETVMPQEEARRKEMQNWAVIEKNFTKMQKLQKKQKKRKTAPKAPEEKPN
jgi:transcriptional adapter 3